MAIKLINSKELHDLFIKGEKFLLIDCRELDEWNFGHINGAVLMPLSNFENEYLNLKDKNHKIIIQCRSGRRSFDACLFLEFNGFTDLSNLSDGILGWHSNDFEITVPPSSL